MTYLVDTNIFLRTLIKENPLTFEDCANFLKLIKKNKIEAVTPGIVLTEIVWTLGFHYKVPREKIYKGLTSITSLSGLRIIDRYKYSAAIGLFAVSSAKYVDCLLATIDEIVDGSWTIVSYDRGFDKLGVKRSEPKDILKKFR